MNVIACLEFEIACNDVTVQHINHYATGTPFYKEFGLFFLSLVGGHKKIFGHNLLIVSKVTRFLENGKKWSVSRSEDSDHNEDEIDNYSWIFSMTEFKFRCNLI